MKQKLYNLTLHRQFELAEKLPDWDVEIEPRLKPVSNMQDWAELKEIVTNAISGIPKNAAVLIGGSSQLCALIEELKFFNLYYIVLRFDRDLNKTVPVGVDPHRKWTRAEKYDAEMVLANNEKIIPKRRV